MYLSKIMFASQLQYFGTGYQAQSLMPMCNATPLLIIIMAAKDFQHVLLKLLLYVLLIG